MAIYVLASLVSGSIFIWFKKLLLATINSDLAEISGVNVPKLELKFLLLTAISVACLVKIVGIFLITSLLILPAAIARNFAIKPGQMLFLAILFSLITIIGGLLFAIFFSLPSGPSIISFGSLILALSILASKIYVGRH